jgi:methylated-DNA-[protein]-cysteine S-methyltransferase
VIGLTVIPAAWGPVRLAADEDAVLAVDVLSTEDSFATACRRRLGEVPLPASEVSPRVRHRLDESAEALAALLAGEPAAVAGIPLALPGASDWDRLVLDGVRRLAWGEVVGYGGLAERIGRRGAARAVGGAVGRNPIGLLIPCHRVIAGDGTLGGYGGGWFGEREALLQIKTALLASEGVHPARRLA